jgi:Tol biopolymer transport system component
MLTVAPDGSDLRIVDTCGVTSHFIWRDPSHILAWSKQDAEGGFYLFEDRTGGRIELVYKAGDGHCSYLPGNEWILCDTYPDHQRNQNVYLHHVATGRKTPLGSFYSPKPYTGEWRCDTHPRFSPDGRKVVIDSPYADQGRQLHLIDISQIVGRR